MSARRGYRREGAEEPHMDDRRWKNRQGNCRVAVIVVHHALRNALDDRRDDAKAVADRNLRCTSRPIGTTISSLRPIPSTHLLPVV